MQPIKKKLTGSKRVRKVLLRKNKTESSTRQNSKKTLPTCTDDEESISFEDEDYVMEPIKKKLTGSKRFRKVPLRRNKTESSEEKTVHGKKYTRQTRVFCAKRNENLLQA